MTIQKKIGDITSVDKDVILHQVNCQGVMGSGVALAIKKKYPKVYDRYILRTKALTPRECLGGLQIIPVTRDLEVINIFGQLYYGENDRKYTSYDALDEAFNTISKTYEEPTTFNFPLIGCGLGGGQWSVVSAIIEHHLKDHELILWELS